LVNGTRSLRLDFLTPSQKEEVNARLKEEEEKQTTVDGCLVSNCQEEKRNNNY